MALGGCEEGRTDSLRSCASGRLLNCCGSLSRFEAFSILELLTFYPCFEMGSVGSSSICCSGKEFTGHLGNQTFETTAAQSVYCSSMPYSHF